MATVEAFKALRPSKEVLVFPGGDAWSAVGHWQRAGLLREDGDPAAYVADCPGRDGAGPIRYLVCATHVGEDVFPLEEAPEGSGGPAPVVTVAPDDHGVLARLLEQAAPAAQAAPRGPPTLARVESARVWRSLRDYLADVPLRTLGPVPSPGGRCLLAISPLQQEGLIFRPYHRGIRGLEALHVDRFLTLLARHATVYDLERPLTTRPGLEAARERLAALTGVHHAVLLALPRGEGKILRFRQRRDEATIRAAPRNPTLRSLDLALLESIVLRTVLGIPDPELPDHPQVVSLEALEEVVSGAASGALQLGFGLKVPPLWELRAVIEAGARLPARTLMAEPTLPAGLVLMAP